MVKRFRTCMLSTIGVAFIFTSSAFAHGFTSVVYVDATSPERGHVRTELGLEYDLLVVSAADFEHDDALFQAGTAAFEDGDADGAGGRARRARRRRSSPT